MNQQLPRWRVSFPMQHAVIAELVAAATVLALASLAWWVGVIAAIFVVAAAGLHYRGATGAGWLGRGVWGRRRPTPPVIPEAVTVELPGVGPVGMRFDGQYAITVIALHGRAFATTELVPDGADTLDTVPLEVIGSLLRQFGGLELHCIDAVSAGRRTAPDGRYTPRYDEIIGDRPAVGERRTWLVLRLCPQGCLKALGYRGDVPKAVAAATERIRQAAVRAGCRAMTCSAPQLNAATRTLLGGHDVERFEQRWTHLRVGNDFVTSYRIAGGDLTSRLLNDLWTIRSNMAVTMLRLTRDRDGAVVVSALVRLHTAMPLTHPPLSVLHPLAGQQLSALSSSIPLGNRSLDLTLSPRPLGGAAVRRSLLVPVGPSGVMLGMSLAGVPLLMGFTDPLKFSKVAINADIDVVQALLLRATAGGATALVHTDRPEVWESICDERMMLETESVVAPTLVVADGETALKRLLATSGERGHALVAVTGTPPADCDIVITEVASGEIVVAVGRRRIKLAIMRPRNETQYLGHLRAAALTR